MKRALQGVYVTISTVGETVKAFVPRPLPPEPPVKWSPQLRTKFDQALVALGRLDSISTLLPDSSLFIYTYVRKEAVLSSMIEGTQSSLSDLLLFELDLEPGVPIHDVVEVNNYVAALSQGIELLKKGLPISSRLFRSIHKSLLAQGRGNNQTPGAFRQTQNWIGGTRPGNAAFVPPPADHVLECMSQLEQFLHDKPQATPVLLKAALAHVQFETIHPFLDGNGRLGRLMITLLLWEHGILREPLLYLSLYFKSHRNRYYELLNSVRKTGDWEAWLEFFADAVIVTATQAVDTAHSLLEQSEIDQNKIKELQRQAPSALSVLRALMQRPISTSNRLVDSTGLTPATVNKALENLQKLEIVRELTNQKRNRIFSYPAYLSILNEGTELPDS